MSPVRNTDLSFVILHDLQVRIDEEKRKLKKLKTDRSNRVAYGFPSISYSQLRYAADGMHSSSIRWIKEGRKQGESASEGTGIFAYYDAHTDTWRRFDNTEVEI